MVWAVKALTNTAGIIFLNSPRNHLTKGNIVENPNQQSNEGAQIGAPKEIESTIAKERMVLIIKTAQSNQADAQAVLDILNANPALDASFCRLFGIKPLPAQPA